MTIRPTEKTQFSFVLVNKRGELARFAEILARANVNMLGISISDGVHTGVLKVVVDDPEAARAAFSEADLQFYEQPILVVQLADKPGALASLCTRLAEQGYSVDYVYGSACRGGDDAGSGCQTEIMVSVADLEAIKALEEATLLPEI